MKHCSVCGSLTLERADAPLGHLECAGAFGAGLRQGERTLFLLAPRPQHTRDGATSAHGAISAQLLSYLAGLQRSEAFNRLSISTRLILLVLALALPLNLLIIGVIWGFVQRANEVQHTSLLYAARSIAAGVDAELGKYVALAETLSRSPALLDDNLAAFEAESRRAFPTGGRDRGTGG
jgi:hypothetical protein